MKESSKRKLFKDTAMYADAVISITEVENFAGEFVRFDVSIDSVSMQKDDSLSEDDVSERILLKFEFDSLNEIYSFLKHNIGTKPKIVLNLT